MNTQEGNRQLQELLEKVREQTNQNLEQRLHLCREFYQEAEVQKDTYFLGMACYYFGECCYKQKMAENSFSYLSRANKYLNVHEEWELLSRSYNMIGLLLQFQGNFMHAVDYFMEGIKIAQEHGLAGRAAALCQNFSALCESVQDYEQALSYREMALVLMQSCCNEEDKELKAIAIRAMLIRLYMKIGQVKNAAVEMKRLDAEIENTPQAKDLLEVLVIQLEYAKKTQNKARASALKERTLKAFYQYPYILECFDACAIIAGYLLDTQDYTVLEELLDTVEAAVGKGVYAELYLQIVQYRIEMYEQQNRMEELAEASRLYFRLSCAQRTEMKKSYCSVLKLRSELRQEEVNNIFLTLKAGTDELSGISNRRRFNEEADRLFEKAYREKKTLGVEMLDIDFFKECNDNYGHQMGDKCIRRIAEALSSIKNRNVFCARYGGDEFVVLYYDMSDSDILECCSYLQESTYKIGKELGLESFSISQGVVNRVPVSGNKIWDFTAAADEALYWVKDRGRDNMRLIHAKGEFSKR